MRRSRSSTSTFGAKACSQVPCIQSKLGKDHEQIICPGISCRRGMHGPNAASSTDSQSFLQSSSLQHWFKNWQELRKDKLTASTFSAAIGFWHTAKRREQLWEEKIGAREPFSGNMATCWNNIKEQEALERYMLITGNSVSLTGFQVYGKKTNHEDNWLAASPDALLDKFYDLPFGGILEIKCPYFNGDMSTAIPLKRMRVHYIPQAQGLMEILDREWMDLYVWTTKGSSLFRLYRNVEYWDLVRTALSDFWWKHVQPARQLCANSVISNPAVQLASFRPAPKHELLGCIVHKSKQIVIDSKLIFREIHGKQRN